MRAYVLIQTQPGTADRVAKGLRSLPEVRHAEGIVGPYDVIVHADTSSVATMGALIAEKVSQVDGVIRALPCLTSARLEALVNEPSDDALVLAIPNPEVHSRTQRDLR